jgi:8-oxo-dGTP pyrophosphatase MutT (NUDIX family)
MPDYIQWIRKYVGHEPIQLNFAAACVVQHGAVLLQLRRDDGRWGFPGGAIELGESAEEAVLREVAEETGLEVRVESLLGIYTKYSHVYPNGDVVQPMTAFFRCVPASGRLQPGDDETDALRFFPLSDVPPLMSAQHDDALTDLRADRIAVFR